MTIRDIFNWILDLELINIAIVIFWTSVFVWIIYHIAIYFIEKEGRKKLHAEMIENEDYRKNYMKTKRSNKIWLIIIVSIFVLYLGQYFVLDTYYNNSRSLFNIKNWF